MLVLLALTIVVSLQTVGVGLVTAMLVTREQRLSLEQALIHYDGHLRGSRSGFDDRGPLSQLLHQRGIRRRRVLVATGIFVLVFVFAPARACSGGLCIGRAHMVPVEAEGNA